MALDQCVDKVIDCESRDSSEESPANFVVNLSPATPQETDAVSAKSVTLSESCPSSQGEHEGVEATAKWLSKADLTTPTIPGRKRPRTYSPGSLSAKRHQPGRLAKGSGKEKMKRFLLAETIPDAYRGVESCTMTIPQLLSTFGWHKSPRQHQWIHINIDPTIIRLIFTRKKRGKERCVDYSHFKSMPVCCKPTSGMCRCIRLTTANMAKAFDIIGNQWALKPVEVTLTENPYGIRITGKVSRDRPLGADKAPPLEDVVQFIRGESCPRKVMEETPEGLKELQMQSHFLKGFFINPDTESTEPVARTLAAPKHICSDTLTKPTGTGEIFGPPKVKKKNVPASPHRAVFSSQAVSKSPRRPLKEQKGLWNYFRPPPPSPIRTEQRTKLPNVSKPGSLRDYFKPVCAEKSTTDPSDDQPSKATGEPRLSLLEVIQADRNEKRAKRQNNKLSEDDENRTPRPSLNKKDIQRRRQTKAGPRQ